MRQTTILTLLVAAVMSVALFFLKYEVTRLDEELETLNRAIDANHDAMHVLRAEWSHLTEIERIRELSHRHLALGPTNPLRIVDIEELPAALEPGAADPGAKTVSATPQAAQKRPAR